MKTEQQARAKFAKYFLDLQAAQRADGAPVPAKSDEWVGFIAAGVEDGDFPPEARAWKCPRSLAL